MPIYIEKISFLRFPQDDNKYFEAILVQSDLMT